MSQPSFPITKFLPHPNLLAEVTGEVNGQTETKQVFNLSRPEVLNLMRYVWTGCYLPTTRDDYVRQLNIQPEGVQIVAQEIDLIVTSYGDIKKDNTQFRDVTWPFLVNLAGKIGQYCKRGGGTGSSSYYAVLIKAIVDYNTEADKSDEEQDKTKMRAAQLKVLDYTGALKSRITELQTDTDKAQKDLAAFRELTNDHGIKLKTTNENVKQLLAGEDGEIQRLETEIKQLQSDLAQEQAEYDHDVKVAASTPAYAWCTFFGLIAAATVSGIFGKRARDMQNTMKDTEGKIDTDEKKLAAARIVTVDCQRMTLSLDSITEIIDDALAALDLLRTGWQSILDDLTGLYDSAKDLGDEDLIPHIEGVDDARIQGVIDGWNDLGVLVADFEAAAFISEPEFLTLSAYLAKYGQA
ncbi:hypothetical protein F5Y09DRAFT_357366 [Xylaria sp. FL1042]|nr:hypothetical protein F5Y09DRAFT_357366 [Xylaria sp. FL1042]